MSWHCRGTVGLTVLTLMSSVGSCCRGLSGAVWGSLTVTTRVHCRAVSGVSGVSGVQPVEQPGAWDSEWMASLLAVPANEGLRSARLGGTDSLGHRRAPGACRPVGNGWVGHIAIAGHRPRSGASRRRASLSRPCASQQGWRRSVVWVSSEQPKRAAVAQLRRPASLCFGMCSGSTAEQPDCRAASLREAAVQDEQLPRAVSVTGFGGNTRTKKRIFEKRLRVRRAHPWATPPCKRLILGALRGSVGAIVQYFPNGGSSLL